MPQTSQLFWRATRLTALALILLCLAALLPGAALAEAPLPPPPQNERQQLLFHPGLAIPAQANLQPQMTKSRFANYARLAYQSYRERNWEIYLGPYQDQPETRLTQNAYTDVEPRLNRGGTKIVFVSRRGDDYDIYTMNVDGSSQVLLTDNTAADFAPSWSPDGTKILFESDRDGQYELYVMNADGSSPTRLTYAPGYDGMPDWSPDGTKIAFSSNRGGGYQVYVMNADGSGVKQLSNQPYGLHPRWSPDGKQIGYDADGNSDGWQGLWVMNADGSSQRLVAGDQSEQKDAVMGSWGPDMNTMAFTFIHYVQYQGVWYWSNSFMYTRDLTGAYSGEVINISQEDWYPDWQSTDLTPPVTRIQPLPAASPNELRINWEGYDPGGSGILRYEVEMRDGLSGSWGPIEYANSPWITTAAYHYGKAGHTYYFRVRGTDMARNQLDWGNVPVASTTVETLPPVTTLNPLPRYSSQSSVWLTLQATDPGGSQVKSFESEYRVGTDGAWTPLYTSKDDVNQAHSSYNGAPGETVYFRVRATDKAGNVEEWRGPDGDAVVTFHSWELTGKLYDNSGVPVSGAQTSVQPDPLGSPASALNGAYGVYGLATTPAYSAAWSKDGYGSLPATSFATLTNAQRDVILPPADDAVTDGGFESGALPSPAWTASGTLPITLSSNWAHTGSQGAALGQPYWGGTENGPAFSGKLVKALVDSSGVLHVLWVNSPYIGAPAPLVYITRAADGTWSAPADPLNGGLAGLVDFAIDANDTLHLAWTDIGGVRYASKAPGAPWSAPASVGLPALKILKLAAGPAGQPHLAGYNEASSSILYTSLEGGQWSAHQTIPASATAYDLHVSPDGALHLVYWSNLDYYVNYITRPAGGAWSSQETISMYGNAPPISKMDADGNLYVMWDVGSYWFYYRIKMAGQSWEAVQVYEPPYYYNDVSPLDFNGCRGKVTLLYNTPSPTNLVYVERSVGSDWTKVQPIGYGTPYAKIAIGPAGETHLVFTQGSSLNYRRNYPETQNGEAALTQQLTIPAGMISPRLSFFYWLSGASAADAAALTVQVQAPGKNTVLLTQLADTDGWAFKTYDMSPWKGQTVTLSFRANQVAGAKPTYALLDDVTLGSAHPDLWAFLPALQGRAGDTVQTTFTLGNRGAAPASGVQLTLQLPDGVRLVSAAPAPASPGSAPVWEMGDFPALSKPYSIQLILKIDPKVASPDKLTVLIILSTSSDELEIGNNQLITDLLIKQHRTFFPRLSIWDTDSGY